MKMSKNTSWRKIRPEIIWLEKGSIWEHPSGHFQARAGFVSGWDLREVRNKKTYHVSYYETLRECKRKVDSIIKKRKGKE